MKRTKDLYMEMPREPNPKMSGIDLELQVFVKTSKNANRGFKK